MNILVMQLPKDIRWNTIEGTPVRLESDIAPGIKFINPRLYPGTFTGQDAPFIVSTTVFIWSDILVFEIMDANINLQEPAIVDSVHRFLQLLKYVSKQSDMPDIVMSQIQYKDTELPEPTYTKLDDKKSSSVRRFFYLETAITWEQIERAASMLNSFEVPVYDIVFQKAISEYLVTDYLVSILFSAIAMESAAGKYLAQAYDDAKNAKGDSSHLRMTKTTDKDGNEEMSDPIFEAMTEKISFANMLHEQPLYLTKRSLEVDNEDLCQRALDLYKARNKIGHSGTIPAGTAGRFRTVGVAESEEAIQIATEVIQWFHHGERYVHPKLKNVNAFPALVNGRMPGGLPVPSDKDAPASGDEKT